MHSPGGKTVHVCGMGGVRLLHTLQLAGSLANIPSLCQEWSAGGLLADVGTFSMLKKKLSDNPTFAMLSRRLLCRWTTAAGSCPAWWASLAMATSYWQGSPAPAWTQRASPVSTPLPAAARGQGPAPVSNGMLRSLLRRCSNGWGHRTPTGSQTCPGTIGG